MKTVHLKRDVKDTKDTQTIHSSMKGETKQMQVYHKDIKQLTQNEHKWMERHIKVCNKMEK